MFEKPAVQAQDRLYDTHKGKVKPFFQIFNLSPHNLLFSLVFSFILSFSHEAILFFLFTNTAQMIIIQISIAIHNSSGDRFGI